MTAPGGTPTPTRTVRPRVADVAVIGAGVVGCAIAEALSRYVLDVVLLEAGADVGDGTSKANTAILHTGFDAKPGTLEAGLVARGHSLLIERGSEYGWPVEITGALMIAWSVEEARALGRIAATAERNGYHETRKVTAGELYAREPRLAHGALSALEIPGEGLLDPWSITLACATNAVVNGVCLMRNAALTGVWGAADGHRLSTAVGILTARWVVNAAGLASDLVDRLFGHARFTVSPRRGQLVVFDKLARSLLGHVLLPVPTGSTKGVLVAPTVFGNVLLGPTAEPVTDRTATGTTPDGLAELRTAGRRILPALLDEEVTALYAGLRAATSAVDYRYFVDERQRYICVGGIRSTGITAALALGERVAADLRHGGLVMGERPAVTRVKVPNLAEARPRPYTDAAKMAADPAYGEIVCHCERVTLGEIRDAMASPVPPANVDGLRRRTRVLLGRCQGVYCGAQVAKLACQFGVGAVG